MPRGMLVVPDPLIDELALDPTFLERARAAHALDAVVESDESDTKPLDKPVLGPTCLWCGKKYDRGFGAFCSRRCADAEVHS